jgi:hypothetical protein
MNKPLTKTSKAIEPLVELTPIAYELPAQAFTEAFHKATAVRSRIAQELATVKGHLGRLEDDMRRAVARLRRKAERAGRPLTRQQLKDELALNPKYAELRAAEHELLDAKRLLENQHAAVVEYLKGWSRLVELRRQELVMYPPAVARRGGQ